MAKHHQEIKRLIEQANQLNYCITKVNLIESAIQIADSYGDIEEGFWLRKELISAAIFSGCAEKAITVFPWCLAKCDQNPKKFSEFQMLWEYKWICKELPKFPQVSREQIHSTLLDLAHRYQRAGKSLRPFFQIKVFTSVMMNDYSEAVNYEEKWSNSERDQSSDCLACELDEKIEFLVYIGEYEKAITEAEPIIQGKLRCSEIPHLTLATLLSPLMKLGRVSEAIECHRKGYPMIAENRDFIKSISEHIIFLVITNNLAKAIELLERHLSWALETVEPYSQFHFFNASNFLMKSLQSKRMFEKFAFTLTA